ncbi:hypothetical protein AMAG_19055 [Allomyces macrogynus ATCC 38327]|uniref:Cyclin N-terminal domain-containing protein n=1 Tax=Allomyces macrogynus (strain ATCC 38327) TaxID=578462 RepID=A0A0L0SN19_ALLM3|nr:hypothetical protein AMAG_19055 [Allomyces macrogynus ATCC 38327]|eukprot:KNE63764.1 hypothetical protein AMAG_19055 [Allomyces macrogynus ATCC 38327]
MTVSYPSRRRAPERARRALPTAVVLAIPRRQMRQRRCGITTMAGPITTVSATPQQCAQQQLGHDARCAPWCTLSSTSSATATSGVHACAAPAWPAAIGVGVTAATTETCVADASPAARGPHNRVTTAGVASAGARPPPTRRGRSRAPSSSSSSTRRGPRDTAFWTDLVVTPARSLVVAWMVNTNARLADFRLHPDTLFTAVHYLDRVLVAPPTRLALPTLIREPATWARALYLAAGVCLVLAAKFLDEYQHPSAASVVAALESAREDMAAIACAAAADHTVPLVRPIAPGDVIRMERAVLESLEFRLMTGTWASPGACLQVWAAEHPLAQHPSAASVVAALESAREDMAAIACAAAADHTVPLVRPIAPGDVIRMERAVLESLEFRLMTGTWASPGACLQVWAAEHPLAVRGLWEVEGDGGTHTDRGTESGEAGTRSVSGGEEVTAGDSFGAPVGPAASTAVTTIATITPPFTPAPASSTPDSMPVMAAPERWPAVLAASPARQRRLATFMATIHQWQTTLLLADANVTRYAARDVAAALYRAATSSDPVVDNDDAADSEVGPAVRTAIAWWQRTAGPPRPRRHAVGANHGGASARGVVTAHAASTAAAAVMRRPRRAASC